MCQFFAAFQDACNDFFLIEALHVEVRWMLTGGMACEVLGVGGCRKLNMCHSSSICIQSCSCLRTVQVHATPSTRIAEIRAQAMKWACRSVSILTWSGVSDDRSSTRAAETLPRRIVALCSADAAKPMVMHRCAGKELSQQIDVSEMGQ